MDNNNDIIQVDNTNIGEEHICCGFSDKKIIPGYEAKKDWMREQFKNGYVFKKLNVRGKVFIDYIPAEKAWAPIVAPGYMYIGCFWVSGRFKNNGHGKALLNECRKDAEKMNGIVAITGKKKLPFLSDKKFLLMQGFEVCDSANPHFELLVLRTNNNAPQPKFTEAAKLGEIDNKSGVAIYYTNICPFLPYYVEEMKETAEELGISASVVKIESYEEAQKIHSPVALASVFFNGKFLTQEIMTKKKFSELLSNQTK